MNQELHKSSASADCGVARAALRRWRAVFMALIACAVLTGPATMAWAETPQVKSPEVYFWESVRNSKDPAELEAYLKAYPHGQFAPLARIRLEKLKAGAALTKPEQPAAQAEQAEPSKPVKMTVTVTVATRPQTQRGALNLTVAGLHKAVAKALGIDIKEGVIVTGVLPNGAAERGGIRPGDIIVEVNGRKVTGRSDFPVLVGAATPGSSASVALWRLASDPQALIARLQRQAAQGDVDSAFVLGWLSATGTAPPFRDYARAAHWLRLAADKGEADAMLMLATLYGAGNGVAKDQAEAANWARKAAEKGSAVAMFLLGSLYERGEGVAKNPVEAARWYQQAADKGLPEGMRAIGVMYANGKGIAKDEAMAVIWFRKAAAKHEPRALMALGWMYENGRGVYQDYAEAVRWFRQAADLRDARAMFQLGNLAIEGRGMAKSDVDAVAWFRKASALGYAPAKIQLGLMYSSGRGGLRRNDTEAVRLFRQAADKGNAAGMFYLGLAYDRGQGVTQDPAESARWYRKAAERGDIASMHNLG
ncbi:MAG: PDZ domain-containing protein, partial [Pseudolabrys sp.]